MKRVMVSMAAALAAAGFFNERTGMARGNRQHGTTSDPDRVRSAELKRARKNAKRVGLVTLDASDATTTVELPK